jgi:hypothetical protein
VGSDCPHPAMNKMRVRHPVRVKSIAKRQRRRLIARPHRLEIPWSWRSPYATILSTVGPPCGFHGAAGYTRIDENDVGKRIGRGALASVRAPAIFFPGHRGHISRPRFEPAASSDGESCEPQENQGPHGLGAGSLREPGRPHNRFFKGQMAARPKLLLHRAQRLESLLSPGGSVHRCRLTRSRADLY